MNQQNKTFFQYLSNRWNKIIFYVLNNVNNFWFDNKFAKNIYHISYIYSIVSYTVNSFLSRGFRDRLEITKIIAKYNTKKIILREMNKFVEIKFNLIELKLFTRKNLDSMKIYIVIKTK